MALLSVGITSSQGVIVGMALDNGNGTHTYSYTVDNTLGTESIFAFTLDFDLAPGDIDWNQDDVPFGGDVAVPTDWIALVGTPTIGQSAQDFLSLSIVADVAPGAMLSGFSFTSAHGPGDVDYTEFDAVGGTSRGLVVGPVQASSAIPEPEFALALLIGAFPFVLRRRRIRM